MKVEVAAAVEEIEAAGIGASVRVRPDPDGGAYTIVDRVSIGCCFDPGISWIGFHIVWTYPDSDVYPHFIDADIRYAGSGPAPNQHPDGNLPTSLTRGAVMPGFELPAIQVSRRSKRRNAETDSALQKLLRIAEFLRAR
jgi:hypothetical protein